jgi:GntR family transcriptional regulator
MYNFKKTINKDIPVPLYFQLKEILIYEIKESYLSPGDAIPTEIELSGMFQISRTTIRQAITDMVKEGYFYRLKGKGTFVAKPKHQLHYMAKIESFVDQIKKIGLTPKVKILECSVVDSNKEISSYLKIPINDKIIKILRLMIAENEPQGLVESYHPYDICSFLLNVDLEDKSLWETFSLNPLTKIFRVERTIESIIAADYESNLLKIKKGSPIQRISNIAYNQYQRPVDFSIAKFRGDRNKFTVEILA